jgi:hypothetical protein
LEGQVETGANDRAANEIRDLAFGVDVVDGIAERVRVEIPVLAAQRYRIFCRSRSGRHDIVLFSSPSAYRFYS